MSKKNFYESVQKIDLLLGGVNEPKETVTELFRIIGKDKALNEYFFGNIKNVRWFRPLRNEGLFGPQNIQFDGEKALYWIALDYLEWVSMQLKAYPEYAKELLEIISDIVAFSIGIRKINHSHIWWSCVKIFNNIPVPIIKTLVPIEDIVADAKYGFRTWLTIWTDFSDIDLAVGEIAEQTLAKFINEGALVYAEVIVEVITRVCSGGKRQSTFITRREDAALRWDPYWVLKAFNQSGEEFGRKCSTQTIFKIADRLKLALEYKQQDYYSDFEIGKDRYRIEVARVPIKEEFKVGEIGFQKDHYACAIYQFSEEKLKDLDPNDVFSLHEIKPDKILREPFIFSAKGREDFIVQIKANLPQDVNWSGVEQSEKKINYLFDGFNEDYSQIWFKTLDRGGLDHDTSAQKVLTTVLRIVLLEKCGANPDEGRKVLEAFLSDNYPFPIFKRFFLLCSDKFWDRYASLLNIFFERSLNPLHLADYEIELQDLLSHHNFSFSETLKEKIKNLIDDIPEYYLRESGGGNRPAAYWQFKWLSPLKDNPDFKDWYESVKTKATPKDDKPYTPERTIRQGGFVVHKAPLKKEEILAMAGSELIKYLIEFKGADFWHGTFEGEPDKEGLGEVLKSASEENPKKFTSEIELYHQVSYFYLHRIFYGFRDAWKAGKTLDWEKIFDFSLAYFKKDKATLLKSMLEGQGEDSGNGKYIYIIEDIVGLIEEGSNDTDRAFNLSLFGVVDLIFDQIYDFLFQIRTLLKKNETETNRDALTYALNTTLGKFINAFISFSLKRARAKQQKNQWGKNKYERFWDLGVETYIWFGYYLTNMRYLDRDWAEEKIEAFVALPGNNVQWQMFMDGYLSYGQVYKDLYFLMRAHYSKALEEKNFSEHSDQRLAQHICIGYLQGDELLQPKNKNGQDSLLWKMLNESGTGKSRHWLEIVGFFWELTPRTIREEDIEIKNSLSDEEQDRIIQFWEWASVNADFVRMKLDNEYPSFLARIAQLTILLAKIDEAAEMRLMLSAPYINHNHHGRFFIEYLTKFQDEESIERIGKIYKKILETTTPIYKQEDIQLLISRLYRLAKLKNLPDAKKDADEICNIYGGRGIHFLHELWKQNQNDMV